MGTGFSKPEFPSEEQWIEWKCEQNKLIQASIKKAQEKSDAESDYLVEEGVELFNNYLSRCHDVSGWKRFTRDNTDCSMARAELISFAVMVGTQYNKNDDGLRELEHIVKKLSD